MSKKQHAPIEIRAYAGMEKGKAEQALAAIRRLGFPHAYLKPRGDDLYTVAIDPRPRTK